MSAAAPPVSLRPETTPRSQAADAQIRISVVIPTCRRPELLQRCLAAVAAQHFDPTAFEIIVVDQACSAETHAAVEVFGHLPHAPSVRYVRPPQGRGPAAARNAGWRAAYGGLIAFTDDDAIPDADWLANGERALTADLVALCGRVAAPELPAATEPEPDVEPAPAEPLSSNAFVRRSALFAVGGFDERFERAWCEDADLQFRLLHDAGAVGHSDAAVVTHPVQRERWDCLRRQRGAYFDALLFKKHPQLCRERLLAAPPWNYYAIVALVVGALGLWLTDVGGSAIVSLLVALVLVVRLTARRLARATRTPRQVFETLATSALIPFLAVYWRLRGAIHFRVLFL